MATKKDPIAVIEAAYRLDTDESEWLEGIAEAISDHLDGGFGAAAYTLELTTPDTPPNPEHIALARGRDTRLDEIIRRVSLDWEQPRLTALFDSHRPFSSLSTCAEGGGLIDDLEQDSVLRRVCHPHGIFDAWVLHGLDLSHGHILALAPLQKKTPCTPELEENWGRVVAHLTAAFRLRRQPTALLDDLDNVDAVLRPDGALTYLSDALDDSTTRDILRRATRAIDRARGRLRRSDPQEAVELWQGLVDGRWSLIDHFDSDGRRFVVARHNAPEYAEPQALTERERQVVHAASLGHGNKLIAYELGIDASTVATHLSTAMTKLGLDSRAQLVTLVQSLLFANERSGEEEG